MEEHLPVWQAALAQTGLSAGQVAAMNSQLNTTTAAIGNRGAAVNAAKAATVSQNQAGSDLRALAADAIRTIKTYAEAQDKPAEVYAAAQIPPPAPPSPAPPPGQPHDLRISVDPTSGALTLTWKSSNGGYAGTTYFVRRKAQGESAYTLAGITGSKTFLDTGFTAGPDMVEYTVQGTRSGVSGPLSSVFQVRFGLVPGESSLQAFVTEGGEAPKLAA